VWTGGGKTRKTQAPFIRQSQCLREIRIIAASSSHGNWWSKRGENSRFSEGPISKQMKLGGGSSRSEVLSASYNEATLEQRSAYRTGKKKTTPKKPIRQQNRLRVKNLLGTSKIGGLDKIGTYIQRMRGGNCPLKRKTALSGVTRTGEKKTVCEV